MEAAGDIAERVKDIRGRRGRWPGRGVVVDAHGSSTPSRRYATRTTNWEAQGRTGQRADGGVIEVVCDNPIPAAMAGLGVGMLVMRAREQSRPSRRMVGGASWRRPADGTTAYPGGYRQTSGYQGTTGDQLSGSFDRAKDTVSDAAERAQKVAGESLRLLSRR